MVNQPKKWTAAERKTGQKATAAWQEFFRANGERAIERLEEINETARIAEVQDKHEAELLALDNVVGVAASFKMTAGQPTRTWSLTALVETKRPKTKLRKASLVPAKVEGVPTDVLEVGKVEALAFDARVRPALPGYSIGHHEITAGTFGCLVRDIRRCCCHLEKDCSCSPSREECPGDYLILSNNHVLANTNRGQPGDLILQPGPIDLGVYPADGIARLERFEPIAISPPVSQPPPGYPPGYNLVDAAVARPINSRDVTSALVGQVMPRGIDQAVVGSQVIKMGRTTQVSNGFVLATNATIVVGYSTGIAQFRHQILTTVMGAGGDSGSLLMDANLSAVGLLFAGSPIITIHNHIADVEAALGVRPLTAPRFG